jgi:hypothetical protein
MTTLGHGKVEVTARVRDTEVLLDHQGRPFAPESVRAVWTTSAVGGVLKLKSVLVMGPIAKRDGTRGERWRHIWYEVTDSTVIGALQRNAPDWVAAFVREMAPAGSVGALA